MTKKILIVTGDAAETLEVHYPLYRCLEEGYEVTIAAPTKKEVQTVVHDKEPSVMEISTERLGYRVQADLLFDEVHPEEYDALLIPGGRAPEYIRTFPKVLEITAHFLDENKPIGTICHGGLLFVTQELKDKVKGRPMTVVSKCRYELEAVGVHFVDDLVYTEKNIVSAQTWRDLPGFMRQFLKVVQSIT